MRRGRLLIYLALILIIGVVTAFFYLRGKGLLNVGTKPELTATPLVSTVEVLTAGQNILPGMQITNEMLSAVPLPETLVVPGLFTNRSEIVGQYALVQISQGIFISSAMITSEAGNINLTGSNWALQIHPGMTAISIPITRLSSVAYGVRAGDFVNVIVSLLLVDVDSSYQSALPNYTAVVSGSGFLPDQLPILSTGIISGGQSSAQGRTELDSALNEPLYLVPSEAQRPRMVTQMLLMNVQVLRVGTFPLPDEETTQEAAAATSATPTPQPAGQVTITASRPDLITLMVTPQDAVTLTYLINMNASMYLTLRNPIDKETTGETEAATLQYLLSQYNIPVPAKLPYAVQPRVDAIKPPELPNDNIVATQK